MSIAKLVPKATHTTTDDTDATDTLRFFIVLHAYTKANVGARAVDLVF